MNFCRFPWPLPGVVVFAMSSDRWAGDQDQDGESTIPQGVEGLGFKD